LVLTYTALGESAEPQGRRLDLPGQALAIIGLGGLAFAAIEGSHWGWTSPVILAVIGLAVCALAAFVIVEEHTPGPLLPLAFLRQPVFSAALAVAALMTFGMYALLFIMPLYFQTMRGASPLGELRHRLATGRPSHQQPRPAHCDDRRHGLHGRRRADAEPHRA
jgi:DHA2 family methylenomycin A resistance protein-like MFS transporter